MVIGHMPPQVPHWRHARRRSPSGPSAAISAANPGSSSASNFGWSLTGRHRLRPPSLRIFTLSRGCPAPPPDRRPRELTGLTGMPTRRRNMLR